MKLSLRSALVSLCLLSTSFAPMAQAGKAKRPRSLSQIESYEFVVSKKSQRVWRMQIKDEHGVIGGKNNGFVDYEVANVRGKDIMHIDMAKGSRRVRGVGEALTKELLRRYPKREIKAELAYVNQKKLLRAWAKGYPHDSRDTDGESLRKTVPALKFEGFNYTITPIGGSIHFVMQPAKPGKDGSIVVEKPKTLDKILESEAPEYIPAKHRPKSDQQIAKEERDNENAAKKAAKVIEDYAEEIADDEGVDEDDLVEHLFDLMDDTCGRGGSSGSGWADECTFTSKGRTFEIEIKKNGKSFDLDDWLEDEAEEFVDDQR